MVSKRLLRILFQESLCVREGGSIIELLEKSKGEWSLPWGLSGQECTCNAGKADSIPGSGRSPGEENGNPLQYSCLGIPWTEEPGGLQSMWVKRRVGHDLASKQQQ